MHAMALDERRPAAGGASEAENAFFLHNIHFLTSSAWPLL
jgi:hypothetical protein